MSLLGVDRRAWRALMAAQLGWMLDAMDFLLFTYAVIQIREEFGLSRPMMGPSLLSPLSPVQRGASFSDILLTASAACAR